MLFSQKFFDNTFGVLASAAFQKRNIREVGYSAVDVLSANTNANNIGTTDQSDLAALLHADRLDHHLRRARCLAVARRNGVELQWPHRSLQRLRRHSTPCITCVARMRRITSRAAARRAAPAALRELGTGHRTHRRHAVAAMEAEREHGHLARRA